MSSEKRPNIRKRGYPLPGGVTILKEGINFSLFARHATRVTLVIDHYPEGADRPIRHEFALDPGENRTGDMWHILLATHQKNFHYGYRIDGPHDRKAGKVYDYTPILIDPYCHALLPRAWGEHAEYGTKPCCQVVGQEFDWQNDRPLKTPLEDTIIYEMHVRGFTRDKSSGVAAPGTFKGLIEKIPYLKSLGVTAVELMPVTEFDENDTVFFHPDTGQRLRNFWGYNPISFFAINSGYAHNSARAIDEFKSLVLAMHQAGIEVYLDMVYNHTGEGSYDGITSNFRGIDNSIFYILDRNGDYYNYSGCGNTVNCNHPVVRHFIRDSLRYWVTEMHIDGFRFDLASILGRDQQGNLIPNPPMIEAIGEDPVLRDTKMIAEAWDAAGVYQVGSFSKDPRWAEWNGRFRDDVRQFMLGADNSITQLATRIAGSSDLYQASGRGPLCSINFITSHDGFTLRDLVSYNQKHNRNNGEYNRDGENNNISWNTGTEGNPAPPQIEQLRWRRMRTFTVLLMISQGVPMICSGDELGRSQGGNNNAWCQDNETSWLDWSLLETNHDFYRFFKNCISLRKQHKVFRRDDFFQPAGQTKDNNSAEITWQYLKPGEENWEPDCHGLGFLLTTKADEESHFFVMINGNRMQTLRFTPPPVPEDSGDWHRIIDTSAQAPRDYVPIEECETAETGTIVVPPFGCIVLQSATPLFPAASPHEEDEKPLG
jgi:isoamylase